MHDKQLKVERRPSLKGKSFEATPSVSDAMLVSGRVTGWMFLRLAERVAFAQQSKEKEFQDPAPKECQCENSVVPTVSHGF